MCVCYGDLWCKYGKNKRHTLVDKRRLKKRVHAAEIVILLSISPFTYRPTVNISLPSLFFLSSLPLPPFQPGIVNVHLRIRQCVRHLSRFYRPITPIATTIIGGQKRKERYLLYTIELTNRGALPITCLYTTTYITYLYTKHKQVRGRRINREKYIFYKFCLNCGPSTPCFSSRGKKAHN